MKSQLDIVDNW